MDFTGERYVEQSNGLEIHLEHQQRYKSILPFVEGKVVLDAACGSGYGTAMISRYAKEVYGIDINEETIEFSKRTYGDAGNLQFGVGSIEALPFEDSFFDIIISFETIEHVSETIQQSFLGEIKRVLKKDGILIISTPNKHVYSDIPNYKNEFHVKEFYVEEFTDFISNYFKYCDIYHQNFHLASVLGKKESNHVKVLNENQISDGRYVILVCSDNKDNLSTSIDTVQLDIQNYYYENNTNIYKFIQEVDKKYGKLYFDLGDGLNEENSIRRSYEYTNNQYIISFSLKGYKNIKGLRWDPIEGAYCRVKLNNIKCRYNNNSEIDILPSIYLDSNGRCSGNTYEFDNLDPMIYLDGNFDNICELLIVTEMEILNDNQLITNIINGKRDLLQENLELKKNIETIDWAIKEKENEISKGHNIIAENNRIINDFYLRMVNYENKLDQLNNSLKKMDSEKVDLNNQLVQKHEQLKKAENEKIQALQAVKNTDGKIRKIQSDLSMKVEESIAYREQIQGIENDLLMRIQENTVLKDEIEKMLNTISWKITKPLRKIRAFFKKRT